MIIQIIQTIFIVFLITIALLQNSETIDVNKSLMPVYVFSSIVYIWLIIIFIVVLSQKQVKGHKKFIIIFSFLIVEIVLTAVFCGNIDNRIDKIKFRKQCGETKATIYKILEEKNWDSKHEKEEIKKIYYFSYDAMGETNHSSFTGRSYEKYKEGDTITIYYNKEKPEDYRLNIEYAKDNFFIIILVLIFGLRIFEIVYAKSIE